MSELLYSTIWNSSTCYKIPIKTGTAVGSNVIATYQNHWFETGDIVTVTASAGYSAFAATNVAVTKVDEDTFTYPLPSAPGIPFPNQVPGMPIAIWVSSKKYSTPLSAPQRIRVDQLPSGTTVDIQTQDDDGFWVTHETISPSDSNTDIIYDVIYKTARLKRVTGSGQPVAKSARTNAPAFTPAATTTFRIPVVPSGELPDIGVPGTYDVVTTNSKGQVISGTSATEEGGNVYGTFTNAGSMNIPKGAPVKKITSTTIERAQANSSKRAVVGLAAETINMGQTGQVILEGVLECTESQWQLVTDQADGLSTDGDPYFLDWDTAGMMLKTINIDLAPTNSYLVSLGYAISSTEFKIEIEQPIKIS